MTYYNVIGVVCFRYRIVFKQIRWPKKFSSTRLLFDQLKDKSFMSSVTNFQRKYELFRYMVELMKVDWIA